MTNSSEAESRAVVGAVRGAIGQARLDAGVIITGLLVDMGSAESVDCRQHIMCWQLTRVLRPSLSEKWHLRWFAAWLNRTRRGHAPGSGVVGRGVRDHRHRTCCGCTSTEKSP